MDIHCGVDLGMAQFGQYNGSITNAAGNVRYTALDLSDKVAEGRAPKRC